MSSPGVTASPPSEPSEPQTTSSSHPATFSESLLALASIRGLGRLGIRAIQDALGELTRVWSAPLETIRAALTTAKTPDAVKLAEIIARHQAELISVGKEEAQRLSLNQIHVLSRAELPPRLTQIPDPPPWLFVEGNVDAIFNRPAVAVVGTRKPSQKGREATATVARIMSAYPITLISGLAEGIDAEAHRASLEEGVVNVAFLGHGIEVFFPSQTIKLRKQILDQLGAVATEYLPKDRYTAQFFVERNRLQAALADLIIPVEANPTGGTAHTLRFARKYRRPIVGIDWVGANGILDQLKRDGIPIANIATIAGRRLLDARLVATVEAYGIEHYGLSRIDRLLTEEAKWRNLRRTDLAQLLKTLTDIGAGLDNGE